MASDIELNQGLVCRYKRLRRAWPQKPWQHALRNSSTDAYYRYIWRDGAVLLPLWEGGGTTAMDYTQRGRTGTITSPTWGIGLVGPHLSFIYASSTSYIQIPQFNYGPTYTLMFWFCSSTADNTGTVNHHLWCHSYGTSGSAGPISRIYMVGTAASGGNAGLIRVVIGDNDDASCNVSTTGARFDDGKWHMLVLTVAGGEGVRIYVDGKFAMSNAPWTGQNGGAFSPTTPRNLYIGRSDPVVNASGTANGSSSLEFFGGKVAFFGIVSRRLTDGQINELYTYPWGWLLPAQGPLFGYRAGVPIGGGDPPDILPEEIGPLPYEAY